MPEEKEHGDALKKEADTKSNRSSASYPPPPTDDKTPPSSPRPLDVEKPGAAASPASKAPSVVSTTEPVPIEASAALGGDDDNDNDGRDRRPALSRTSTQRPAIVPVPRSERRGLFSSLTLIPEVTSPVDYPDRIKWTITAVVALAGMASPIGSSIIMPALQTVAADLHAPAVVVNLNFALYMLAMAVFPLWWSSFSETTGRRSVYLVSFALNAATAVVGALAPNVGVLVAFRVLGGGASASVHAVGAGTLADIWEPRERGRAMGMFYIGPLCGPFLAPIIGGALTDALGWRSTQWFLAGYGAVTLAALTLVLPETLAKRQKRKKTEKQQRKAKQTLTLLRRWLWEPLLVVKLVRFPAIVLTNLLVAAVMCGVAVLNIGIQHSFSHPPYSFSNTVVGLLYTPNSLGYLLASIFGGRWIDRVMEREARRAGRYDAAGKLVYRPEDRVRENAWAGVLSYPAALLAYGWTTDRGVFWAAPMAANFVFGVGSMLIFALTTTMLTEFLPRRASAGIALNNLIRNVLGCIGGVAAEPWIVAVGSGWVYTTLAVASTVLSVGIILAFRRYSEEWRVKMEEVLAREEAEEEERD